MKVNQIVEQAADIIFNLGKVSYEGRGLPTPSTEFVLGEWVGLAAGNKAVKITGSTLASNIVAPRMVLTPTDRHDVAESEKITVARGAFDLSTTIYKTGSAFAVGSEVKVVSDGGIGVLGKYSSGAGVVVGIVKEVPVVDGTDPLIVEVYETPLKRLS